MNLIIENVDIINEDKIEKNKNILIEGGIIKSIGEGASKKGIRIIDGRGLCVFPGFCDMHSHLRDPGFTSKEDLVSGTLSAASGGFTTVCCMPNTKPVCDNPEVIKYITEKSESEAYAKVLPVAAITCGMKGQETTDFEALTQAGAIAFSDDGLPVMDGPLLRSAMGKAKVYGALLMLHEENLELKEDGVVHKGKNSTRAGLPGIPREVEDTMTARDVAYAAATGAKVHICHVSTKGSVSAIRRAKSVGADITCETAPHYFSLTDEEILTCNPNAKMNPPLREEEDRQAVINAISDGTIDVIATDHAPHTPAEKASGILKAPFGIIGFETAFPLTLTNLVNTGKISLNDIARLLSAEPRRRLGIGGGEIKAGETADFVLCDIVTPYVYKREDIVSKSKNSPIIGKELYGKVLLTICEGSITYDRSID